MKNPKYKLGQILFQEGGVTIAKQKGGYAVYHSRGCNYTHSIERAIYLGEFLEKGFFFSRLREQNIDWSNHQLQLEL